MVHPRADKAAEKEEMRRVYLHTVKTGFLCTFGSVNKLLNNRLYLVNRHIIGLDLSTATVKRSERKLGYDFAILLVNQICQLLVLRNQTVA